MVSFDGDDQATKVTLRSLLDHNFSVVALTQVFSDEDQDQEQEDCGDDVAMQGAMAGDSSDEDEPVASLRFGRTAAAAARARMSNRSPSASISSSSAWSPPRRRSPTDSSPDSSPLAEQPTPPGSQPRRSPRRSPAALEPEPEPEQACAEPEQELDSSDEETERLASERTNYGAKVVCKSKDKYQPVKQLEWTLTDPSKITEDAREEYPGSYGTKYEAVLLNNMQPVGKQLDVYQLWKHMLPPEWMKRFADTANKQLDGASLDPNYRFTDAAEVEVVLGLALAACVHGSGPFDSFFSNTPSDEFSLFPPPGFGRYGVNKNRALILLRMMHLSHGPDQPGASNPNPNPDPNPNPNPNPIFPPSK